MEWPDPPYSCLGWEPGPGSMDQQLSGVGLTFLTQGRLGQARCSLHFPEKPQSGTQALHLAEVAKDCGRVQWEGVGVGAIYACWR